MQKPIEKNKQRGAASPKEKKQNIPIEPIDLSDPIDNVQYRNRFFYVEYRGLIVLALLSMILLVVSIFANIHYSTKKIPPIYLPVTKEGTLLKDPPLSENLLPTDELMESAVKSVFLESVRTLNTWDYLNFLEQINKASVYFTITAWNDYIEDLVSTNNVNSFRTLRLISLMEPLNAPVVTDVSVVGGVKTWVVKMSIQVKLLGHGESATVLTQTGDVFAKIERVSTNDSPNGVAISQYVFVPKEQ